MASTALDMMASIGDHRTDSSSLLLSEVLVMALNVFPTYFIDVVHPIRTL